MRKEFENIAQAILELKQKCEMVKELHATPNLVSHRDFIRRVMALGVKLYKDEHNLHN